MTTTQVPPEAEHFLAAFRNQVEHFYPETHAILTMIDGSGELKIEALPDPHDMLKCLVENSARLAVMSVDTYMLTAGVTNPEDYAGRLGDLFAAGDSNVTEAILVMVANASGLQIWCQKYEASEFLPGRFVIEWGEVEDAPSGAVQGRMAEAIRVYFASMS